MGFENKNIDCGEKKSRNKVMKMAAEYHRAGQLDSAADLYQKVLRVNPKDTGALHLLGIALFSKGDLEEGLLLIDKAIQCDPSLADCYKNRSIMHEKIGCLENAIADVEDFLALKPESCSMHSRLGVLLMKSKELQKAMQSFQAALAINSDDSRVCRDVGYAYFELGEFGRAVAFFKKALKGLSQNVFLLGSLGEALIKVGFPAEAIQYYEKALLIEENVDLYVGLGDAYAAQKQFHQAEKYFQKAIQKDPQSTKAYFSLGSSYEDQAMFDEAIFFWEKVLQIDPDYSQAQLRLSLAFLRQGQYDLGWPLYESRFLAVKKLRQLAVPSGSRFVGQNLENKVLFLYSEQGLGDLIQCFRYIDLIKKRNGKIVFSCPQAFQVLFKSQSQIDNIITYPERLKRVDFSCSLQSLPYVFKTTLDSIPSPEGYLSVPGSQKKVDIKKGSSKKLHVALVWSGNPRNPFDAERSISLDLFSPLIGLDDVQLYSLQYGERSQDIKTLGFEDTLIDLSPEISDFGDTASVLDQLDLLITVDSAPAHLAGALGVPAWVLVTAVPDWRWMLDREDSPWYDSIRLFRQPEPGDWASAIQQVKDQLIQKFDLNKNLTGVY